MSSDNQHRFDCLETDELLALSKYDIESGRLDEALLKLKRILSEEQPPALALSMAARLYGQLKLFDRAAKLFRQYVELDSGAVTELFQLGMSLYDGGNPDDAMVVWEKVLIIQPLHPPACFYKGLALAQKGEIVAAQTQLNELVRKLPADNLYFSRARDLLKELEGIGQNAAQEPELDKLLNIDLDAYKTIQ